MTEEALLLELRSINDRLTSLQGRLEVMCPEHSRRLVGIEQTLDGPGTNGNHVGLKTRVTVVEKAVDTINERYDQLAEAFTSEYTKMTALGRKMLWTAIFGPTGVMALFGTLIYFMIGK